MVKYNTSNPITLLLGLFLFCFLSACEKPDFQEIDSLPVSNLELTDHRGNVPRVFKASELNGFVFEDQRDYDLLDCGNFRTRLDINDSINFDQSTYQLRMLFEIHTKLDSTLLQHNKILFKEIEDFQVVLDRDLEIYDALNPCNTRDDRNYILFAFSETILPDKGELISINNNMVVKSFDRVPIRIGTLGYLKMNLEIEFTASNLNTTTPPGTVLYYPMTLKLEHAIRYPELDE